MNKPTKFWISLEESGELSRGVIEKIYQRNLVIAKQQKQQRQDAAKAERARTTKEAKEAKAKTKHKKSDMPIQKFHDRRLFVITSTVAIAKRLMIEYNLSPSSAIWLHSVDVMRGAAAPVMFFHESAGEREDITELLTFVASTDAQMFTNISEAKTYLEERCKL